ncbi:hypothetical protein CEUSTIGMA_g4051.t1 [Chlamydomonas eustigma]|uniref:Rhodanese domain-containing protein n=1 Tax=Chlamydomonas eustigma TaxID=1157962 RepID=A0A250X0N0_9CHLO|nr:hypothetical protein CEUSTIGMA_g4051.t1 [Chlamydomonas eustigma]|eukprot:GAX76605.1 hypothetical protein CEUSTIGMA_g4051.t1 [Chlamydomonas eustigma]
MLSTTGNYANKAGHSCNSSFMRQGNRCSSKHASVLHPNQRNVLSVLKTKAIGQWPDPDYIQETRAQYEGLGSYAKPVADPDEARVLLSIGYVWLDVRSQLEVERRGKVKGSLNIPFIIETKKYDEAQQKTVITSKENVNFIVEVQKYFPRKEEALILVGDSNGRNGGQEALSVLENAGYINLVGVVGGFAAFWRVFDAKLARRASRGAFLEDPWAPGDSQGLFAGES